MNDQDTATCWVCQKTFNLPEFLDHVAQERVTARQTKSKQLLDEKKLSKDIADLFEPAETVSGSSAAHEIVDGFLWLGSIVSARDEKFLTDTKISHVLDVNGDKDEKRKAMYSKHGISWTQYGCCLQCDYAPMRPLSVWTCAVVQVQAR